MYIDYNYVVIPVRVTKEQYEQLKMESKEKGKSMAEIIRALVDTLK